MAESFVTLLSILISILILGIVVERATELVHEAKIFLPLRNLIAIRAYPMGAPPLDTHDYGSGAIRRRIALFLHSLVDCGYCTSVWVAMVFAFVCPLPSSINALPTFAWLIKLILLHGTSNLYHVIYENRKKLFTHPIPIQLIVDMTDKEEQDENV